MTTALYVLVPATLALLALGLAWRLRARVRRLTRELGELRRAREAWRDDEARYRMAESTGRVGSWEYDLVTTHFWGSDGAKAIYGFDPAEHEFSTDAVEDCIPERERVHQALVDLIERDEPYDLEFEILPKDGSAARVITSVAVLHRDDRGRPLKVAGVIQDVTRRARDLEQRRRAEEQLALLSFALNNVREAAFLVDEHGRFQFANEEACRILGYTRDELLGLGVADVDPDFPLARWPAHWAQLRRERTLVFDGRHRTKDGRLFPVEVNANYLEYRGAGYNLALVRDITERRRIVDALRASEEKYRRIVDTAAEGILAHDPDGRITFANARMADLLGCSVNEVVGRPLTDFVFDEDLPDHRQRMAARSRGLHETYERRLKRSDGQRVWSQVTASPVLDPVRGFVGSFAMFTDTTLRRRNEAVNAARLHLVRFSLTHSVGELLEETLNRAEELTGSRVAFYYFVDEEQASLTRQAWSSRTRGLCKPEGQGPQAAVSDPGVLTDCLHQRAPVVHNDCASLPKREGAPPGHAEVVRELAVPVFRGDKIAAILVIGDKAADYDDADVEVASLLAELAWEVTIRKRAEDDVRELNQVLEQRVAQRTAQLEAANKDLESFAYSVSHDLRAPLRHVDGYLELLAKRLAPALDDKGKHYMTQVSEATQRMSALIDDLLSFSRAGRQEIVRAWVDLEAELRGVMRELEPDVRGRRIDWQVGALPQVQGDRAMLHAVLLNLVGNALKFTRGRAQAEIIIGSVADDAAEVTVFVRDNGVGFDMQYAHKLFGVFQRLHAATDFEGTGIGLANVRRIIERHGGRTWAEGRVDVGATFYFALPCERAEAPDAALRVGPPAAQRGPAAVRSTAAGSGTTASTAQADEVP